MAISGVLTALLSNTNALLVFGVALLSAMFLLMRPRGLPPGPWSGHILGHIMEFRRCKDYHLTLMQFRRKYGDIFRLRFGLNKVIVLTSPSVIREALVEKAQYFSDRPSWFPLINKVIKSRGIIFNLHNWQTTRRFAMTTMRDFGVGKSPIEQKCLEEFEVLAEEFIRHEGKPFNCQFLLSNALSNIICGVVFNRRFDYDDDNFQSVMRSISTSARLNSLYSLANHIPGVMQFAALFGKGVGAETVSYFTKMERFVRSQIESHRSTFDPDNIRDFTDMFLMTEREGTGTKISEDDAYFMIRDMFAAGTETTSTTLQWFFVYMLYNQEVQERCRQEINKVIGSSRPPAYSDRGTMIYTEATLLEVQRMATITPFALPHSSICDVKLGDYVIPKNSVIMPFIYSCHRSPEIWGDPDNFRPERWIDDDGKLRHFQAYMPFSIGKRACAGEMLAKMEIFLFGVSFLQRFRFKMSATPPNMVPHVGTTLLPEPFEIVMEQVA